ncbi:MAG: hypothetical protein SVU32_07575 [Candidatus Nanohaloarchaea archaeon]|nr:hypothetical protein [Candidatus Nanohaloarchaea archaeon]
MKPHTDEEYSYRERLRDIVGSIDTDVDAVIVEGRDDMHVLRRLGLSVRVFRCGGRGHEQFCNDVARVSEKVVILTDFDEHGKELNKKFSRMLSGDVDIISSYRRDFGKLLTSQDRYCVEDIRPLFSSRVDKYIDATLDRLFTPYS